MATQHIVPSAVPQQKSAVIPIDSPAQVIPIAEPIASQNAGLLWEHDYRS